MNCSDVINARVLAITWLRLFQFILNLYQINPGPWILNSLGQNNRGQGSTNAQKLSKMCENTENMKNCTFLDSWHIGTPEILLKWFIQLRPGLVNVVQDIFQNNGGQGSTNAQNGSKNWGPQSFEMKSHPDQDKKIVKTELAFYVNTHKADKAGHPELFRQTNILQPCLRIFQSFLLMRMDQPAEAVLQLSFCQQMKIETAKCNRK